mmetsp:Transcript_45758/g.114703  ORF Transcript_45758/g.114703 Transcript_45758/m.114703 type:complete len:285 (+) Transcript_45758:150-1004(+)|eukprot:CAMPEP_0173456722 /NCGR_PEP_ID=MMETSP1357-20121228/56475_1 /TAXON_ID=77926 /ORGANISM="Hemiselmis rufescens, Strain PCC563" /LENGTH=284 /DNA_ID=CAMNT_0014423965 /DNA_START=57 /DNA_END=911 /DNA_ORIENTATION=-
MPMQIGGRPDQWGGALQLLMQSDEGDRQQINGRVGGKYVPKQSSLGIEIPYRSGRSPRIRSPPPVSPTSSQMVQWSAVKEISGLSQSQPHGRGAPDPAVTLHVPPPGGRIVLDQLTRAGRAKSIASKGIVWRPPTSYQFGYEGVGAKPHMARYDDKWTPQWTPYSQGPASFTSAIHERPSAAAEGPLSFASSHHRHTPAVAFSSLNDYASARSRGFSAFAAPRGLLPTQAAEEPAHYRDSRPNPKMRVSYNSRFGFEDKPQGVGSEMWSEERGDVWKGQLQGLG